MRELALERNFVVSVVPVSKETPMFDPARLFAAAIRVAEVPGANDDVMTVALSRLKPETEPYDRLEKWATDEARSGSLSAAFAALLWLIPHLGPEDHARIRSILRRRQTQRDGGEVLAPRARGGQTV